MTVLFDHLGNPLLDHVGNELNGTEAALVFDGPAAFLANDLRFMVGSLPFGETVYWRGNRLTAIFDDEDVEVQLGEGPVQIVPSAVITGVESDFPNIAEDDPVVARNINYIVKNWKRDGTGMIEIFMERV